MLTIVIRIGGFENKIIIAISDMKGWKDDDRLRSGAIFHNLEIVQKVPMVQCVLDGTLYWLNDWYWRLAAKNVYQILKVISGTKIVQGGFWSERMCAETKKNGMFGIPFLRVLFNSGYKEEFWKWILFGTKSCKNV